ncbi:MAG: hypothetical protein WDO71_04670 [Bacteroidota bacterium]
MDYKTLVAKKPALPETPTGVPHKLFSRRPIIQAQDGKFIAQYPSIKAASKSTGLNGGTISKF